MFLYLAYQFLAATIALTPHACQEHRKSMSAIRKMKRGMKRPNRYHVLWALDRVEQLKLKAHRKMRRMLAEARSSGTLQHEKVAVVDAGMPLASSPVRAGHPVAGSQDEQVPQPEPKL